MQKKNHFNYLIRLIAILTILIPVLSKVELAYADKRKKQESKYAIFKGKIINSISYKINEIFEKPESNALYRQANNLKINTKVNIISQELLFKEGQSFDPFLLEESERALRQLKFLRNINISANEGPKGIDIIVSVQDTWTIIPQLSYSSGTGKSAYAVGLADSNLLGYGKRFEALYSKDESVDALEAVYDDQRVWGSKARFIGGVFHRSDGDLGSFFLGKPYRSLVQNSAWALDIDLGDYIGKLYENGEERFIYRNEKTDLNFRYSFARGNPTILRHRFTFGYGYSEANFEMPTSNDFVDVDVDPNDVSQDPALLASNRRFSGPTIGFEEIEPDFISMNYIDRFDRVEDYNLGREYSVNAQLAPEILGSVEDTYLFSASTSDGYLFSENEFIRGEIGGSSRVGSDEFDNSLIRAELKYFNVLGFCQPFGFYLGRHTLASSFAFEYGYDFDRDRELLVGGDNFIRGYDGRTFTGDKRIGLNIEDRMHFIDDAFELISIGGAVFADASGSASDNLNNLISDGIYSSVGFGLRLGFPRSSGGRVLRIDIAFPLRDGPDGASQFEPRLVISGGQLFNSRLRTEAFGTEKANIAVGGN